MSVEAWALHTTPFAIVDVETTGLNAGWDRVTEIAVLHYVPATGAVTLAFDSLVNPQRPLCRRASEVSGISEDDVRSAPTFSMIAADVLLALAGSVIVAFNAPFDIRFMQAELHAAGVVLSVPFLDVLLLRPALGVGPKATLEEVRAQMGLASPGAHHMASSDAAACGAALRACIDAASAAGLRSFADLRPGSSQAVAESFARLPLHQAAFSHLRCSGRACSRAAAMGLQPSAVVPDMRSGILTSSAHPDYLHALLAVLADYRVNDDERAHLLELQRYHKLTPEQVRAMHARAFQWHLSLVADDDWLDDDEVEHLASVRDALGALGWAP